MMCKFLYFAFSLMLFIPASVSAQGVAGAVEGTVKSVDTTAKTIAVKTADGTEDTFHYAESTAVHGTRDTATGSRDTYRGLKEGSHVVVHYTGKGTDKTADEIDNLGKNGLKVGEGTVKTLDRNGRTLTVKTADGAEDTYRLSERASRDAGKGLTKGSEKSVKVTVYYTEEAGHKIAHFFKKTL
jgi:hypothetical protein